MHYYEHAVHTSSYCLKAVKRVPGICLQSRIRDLLACPLVENARAKRITQEADMIILCIFNQSARGLITELAARACPASLDAANSQDMVGAVRF